MRLTTAVAALRSRAVLRQVLTFATIGAASTALSAASFVVLRTVMGVQAASFLALAGAAVLNTAANRRLTFGIAGSHRLGVHHAAGFSTFILSWGLTAAALAVLHAATDPGRALEVTVLVLAAVASTVLRFFVLRRWLVPERSARVAQS